MSVNVLYKTSAKATGGRDGHAATLDGTLDVKLTTPKELGGGGGAGGSLGAYAGQQGRAAHGQHFAAGHVVGKAADDVDVCVASAYHLLNLRHCRHC